ncbi:hypothetical protein [Bacillariodnavirus LDMD-2013]|uniref:Uncharacterized protein n=1 Tax=Bacillariodnavirus LDMD-2013 TaxID=1379694 RepID=S5T668_9VIRU|nr:hypothetical protein [Bacillariodnavirus LDMD-2013]AGS36179.1 hypothetical protein [Bacillariodnavirus LDMD-2013]
MFGYFFAILDRLDWICHFLFRSTMLERTMVVLERNGNRVPYDIHATQCRICELWHTLESAPEEERMNRAALELCNQKIHDLKFLVEVDHDDFWPILINHPNGLRRCTWVHMFEWWSIYGVECVLEEIPIVDNIQIAEPLDYNEDGSIGTNTEAEMCDLVAEL